MRLKSKSSTSRTRRSAQNKSRNGAKAKTVDSRRSASSASSGAVLVVTAVRALAVGLAAIGLGTFCYWAARVTFTPVHDHGQAVGNTQIGHSLRFYLDRPSIKEAIQQVGGNLALLTPLGVLLPIVFSRLQSLPGIIIIGALTALAVETGQGALVPGRAFDIDDVVLNVIGVAMAYLLAGRRIAALARGRAAT